MVGTEHTDGLRLAYLPKYCDPDAPEQTEDDDARSTAASPTMLRKLARPTSPTTTSSTGPSSARRWSSRSTRCGARARASRRSGPASRASALASASQVYPRLLNGDSVVQPRRAGRGRDVRRAWQLRGTAAGRRRWPPRPEPCTRSRARRSSSRQGPARCGGLAGPDPRARRAHGHPAGRHQPADRRLVGDGLDHPADLHRLRPRGDAAAVRRSSTASTRAPPRSCACWPASPPTARAATSRSRWPATRSPRSASSACCSSARASRR